MNETAAITVEPGEVKMSIEWQIQHARKRAVLKILERIAIGATPDETLILADALVKVVQA